VTAGRTATLDFAHANRRRSSSSLVVTGTAGAAERKTIGNSVTQLDVADLTQKQAVLNVSEVLQSKTPGVSVLPAPARRERRARFASAAQPRSAATSPSCSSTVSATALMTSGASRPPGGGTLGLAQSTQVTSALNFLNPNDIESIEVIKGPAAATLYGAEAANGVIQIITKKGTRGQQKMQFGLRGERGTSEMTLDQPTNYTTCDAVKRAQLETGSTQVSWPGCQNVPDRTIITDNPLARDPLAMRTGDLSIIQMNVRGGGERYSFYLSGDRNIEQGVFFNSDNSQKSARTNFTVNPNDKLDFTVNVNWQDGRLRLPIQDESANGLMLSGSRGQPGHFRPPLNQGWREIGPTGREPLQELSRLRPPHARWNGQLHAVLVVP
jgi:TonB-dependent SusC/RagA subfamily outer membrane receptor